MNGNPKVSCVILTHNRINLLHRAVKSVMDQTYNNIEIIIVDDASTDGTKEFGEALKRNGVKYIYINPEKSKGGNFARNLGIKACTGDYIAFLDDDDYWLPEKTEKQVEFLQRNPDKGMVYSGWGVDYGSRLLNYNHIPNKDYDGDIVSKQLYISPFTSTITIMIRKDILDQIEGFDEKLRYWQEYELVLRIIQITKIGLISEALSVANRERKVIRLTNKLDAWKDSVEYINTKHKDLFEKLSDDNKRKREEYYYKEAAYRASAAGNKQLMRAYYQKAYEIRHKIEYWVRFKFGISKESTLVLESLYMKLHNLIQYRR